MERRLAAERRKRRAVSTRPDTADLQDHGDPRFEAGAPPRRVKTGERAAALKAGDMPTLARPTNRFAHRPRFTLDGDQRRGAGVVGYNVQVAVETEHHLIVAHEVTNMGSDRSQLPRPHRSEGHSRCEQLDAVADRGYFNSQEIKECEQAGITVTLPKPQTSGAKAEGRFGKQDFVYLLTEDVYRCPGGREAGLSLYERGGWQDAAPLLDDDMPALPAQIPVYDRTRVANHAMGTRARA